MWLAIIMFINVWFIIWPNQQSALNINNKFPDARRGGEGGVGENGDAVLAHEHVPVRANAGGDDRCEHVILAEQRLGSERLAAALAERRQARQR